MSKKIAIVGAGLVGSLLAILMRKKGYDVTVYERRPDMRLQTMSAGRSINLALSDRGIKALELAGVMDEIKTIAIPMHGRFLHLPDGSSGYQPYGQEGQFINSVSRGDLNKKLMDIAEKNGAKILFEHKCEHINFKKNEIEFSVESGKYAVQSDLIFGADGAYAATRLNHQLQHDRFQYQQFYIDYGYKELLIPADENNGFKIEKNALHIWPRGNYMLIALPNMDGSFTCTLFFPFDGEPSFSSLNTKEKVEEFFEKEFADAKKIMPTLVDDFYHNPTSSLVTVKCFPWVREDKFALIGDAAHAIVPFFGQGMNAGFEDCSVLHSLMEKYGEDWSTILDEFQNLRKPDGDAIADLAITNFVEMRDKVADEQFLLQKKIENKFSKSFPQLWIPAYGMVTFSPEMRYSEALAKGEQQQKIMDIVMQMADIKNIWDSKIVEDKMLELLKKE